MVPRWNGIECQKVTGRFIPPLQWKTTSQVSLLGSLHLRVKIHAKHVIIHSQISNSNHFLRVYSTINWSGLTGDNVTHKRVKVLSSALGECILTLCTVFLMLYGISLRGRNQLVCVLWGSLFLGNVVFKERTKST